MWIVIELKVLKSNNSNLTEDAKNVLKDLKIKVIVWVELFYTKVGLETIADTEEEGANFPPQKSIQFEKIMLFTKFLGVQTKNVGQGFR